MICFRQRFSWQVLWLVFLWAGAFDNFSKQVHRTTSPNRCSGQVPQFSAVDKWFWQVLLAGALNAGALDGCSIQVLRTCALRQVLWTGAPNRYSAQVFWSSPQDGCSWQVLLTGALNAHSCVLLRLTFIARLPVLRLRAAVTAAAVNGQDGVWQTPLAAPRGQLRLPLLRRWPRHSRVTTRHADTTQIHSQSKTKIYFVCLPCETCASMMPKCSHIKNESDLNLS